MRPTWLVGLTRGLTHRAGTTLAVFCVALVASAAAATGPAYYASAKTSILRDSFGSAPLIGRGIEVSEQGVIALRLDGFAATATAVVRQAVPDTAARARLLAAPIQAIEGTAFFTDLDQNPVLAWRAGFCAHLRFAEGRCATAPNEVVVSSSLAKRNGWRIGQQLEPSGWHPLKVVGVYRVPDVAEPYWFDRGSVYFPTEDAATAAASVSDNPLPDALFTPQATIDANTEFPQGTLVFDQLVDVGHVHGGDLGTLSTLVDALSGAAALRAAGAGTQSGLPGVVNDIHASWHALEVPVFLISAQLLVLVWLLMFLVVTDAVETRGAEIALMKLRGFRGARLLWFGLGEPVALLAVCLPLGVLVGWAATGTLAAVLLRAGIPVELPVLSWAAAAAATVGGLAAVVLAGRRTLRRSIVEEWQRGGRRSVRRDWVLDAVLLTGAVAGLVELLTTGRVTSVDRGALGLLVPGLLGVAVAVVGSRLLPLACRALFGTTRRRGSLGVFLAVRHIARRPGAARTTVILATAFALATFGLAAWSIGHANRSLVAAVGVGAPTVLTVAPPAGTDLGAVVERIDPGGTKAAVVDSYFDATGNGRVLLAVDPQRFAHVAAWRGDFAPQSLAALTTALAPPAAPPVRLDGDMIRLHLDVADVNQPGQVVRAHIASPGAEAALSLGIGTVDQRSGEVTLTAELKYCPCSLVDLTISQATANPANPPVHGAISLRGIEVHGPNGWRQVPGVTAPSQWRTDAGAVQGSPGGGVSWAFDYPAVSAATLSVADRPDPLPALMTRSSLGHGDRDAVQIDGLDQHALTVRVVAATAALPGTVAGGAVVDRTYAERAAAGVLSATTQRQVWVASGAGATVTAALKKAGVRVTAVQTAGAQRQLYDRQGPGLASVVFFADAVAAALLAAAGATLSVVVAGRRRRYEYAALEATGASRRSLYAGLALEQAAVLVFGTAVGIGAGVAAALLAVRSVPEFVTTPASPPLSYTLSTGVLATWLGLAFLALLAVAAISSWVLLAGTRAEQLREGAP